MGINHRDFAPITAHAQPPEQDIDQDVYLLTEESMTEDITPSPIAPTKPARRRNLVAIEATEQALALAVILGQTPEQFVAQAVAAHVASLTAKITAQVAP